MNPSKPLPLSQLFRIWLRIGATSFGGGAATQALIYHHFVTKRKLIAPEAFSQQWAIVQFAPGINLIALTVLIGHTLGGATGVAASLAGMLLPSAGITAAMTALYAGVRDQPAVQGALRGITPALVGLSLAFMWRLLKPPMGALAKRGTTAWGLGAALVAAAAALTALQVPVLASYLVGAGGLGIAYGVWGRPGSAKSKVQSAKNDS